LAQKDIMKTLIIARHAKSDWTQGQSDHERTLNARGLNDAPIMGKRLTQRLQELHVDLVISSSAQRAQTTAQLLAAELNYAPEHIRIEDCLYASSPQTWKSIIEGIDEKYSCVLIVGHNPEISNVVSQLSGGYQELSPCTIAQLDYADRPWRPLSQADTCVIDRPT